MGGGLSNVGNWIAFLGSAETAYRTPRRTKVDLLPMIAHNADTKL